MIHRPMVFQCSDALQKSCLNRLPYNKEDIQFGKENHPDWTRATKMQHFSDGPSKIKTKLKSAKVKADLLI